MGCPLLASKEVAGGLLGGSHKQEGDGMGGRQAVSLGVGLKSKGYVLCQHLYLSIPSSFLESCHF